MKNMYRKIINVFQTLTDVQLRFICSILFLLILLTGAFYVNDVRSVSEKSLTKNALAIAQTVVVNTDIDLLSKLNVNESDIGMKNYESLKSRLMQLPEIDSDIRFAYFMQQNNGKVYFMADSEPVDSEDYSPPGQEFTEADSSVQQAFAGEEVGLTEATTDRWGTWVSTLVPVKDVSGKVVAVFGIDYSAERWQCYVRESIVAASTRVLVFVLLAGLFFREIVKRRQISREKAKIQALSERALLLQKKAEEASVVKSQFLANMSHEIRTPMNGVVGFLQLLQEQELPEEQKKYIDLCMASSRDLLRIINDILDFSKMEAKKMELDIRPFDLYKAINMILESFKINSGKSNVQLVCKIDENVPRMVSGDMLRFRQIMNNLLANAFKFTEKGCVEVKGRLLQNIENEAVIEFTVADTGIGMSKEVCSRIFQPFTQADNSTTRVFGGTGLGLVIAKELTGLMGGGIKVASVEGKGTVFTFTVKVEIFDGKLLEADGCNISESNKEVAVNNLKILSVDDNVMNRKLLGVLLKKMGCKSDFAANGKEACEMCAANTYDLVFMDCQMPVMDGYEATEKIRSEMGGGDIIIIAMTANAMAGDREKCLEAGMDDYITKPLEVDVLREKLHVVHKFKYGNKILHEC